MLYKAYKIKLTRGGSMGKTIYVDMEPVYRESLVGLIRREGYNPCIPGNGERVEIPGKQPVWLCQTNSLSETGSIQELEIPVLFIGRIRQLYWLFRVRKHTRGYIAANDVFGELFTALKATSNGEPFLSKKVKQFLKLSRVQKQDQLLQSSSETHLTKSELEILLEIAAGKTTTEIAHNRICSYHTVKTHRKNIRQKLGLLNKERLVVFAVRMEDGLKTLLEMERNKKEITWLLKNTS